MCSMKHIINYNFLSNQKIDVCSSRCTYNTIHSKQRTNSLSIQMTSVLTPEAVEFRLTVLTNAVSKKDRLFFVEHIYILINEMKEKEVRYYSKLVAEEITQAIETINFLVLEDDWVQALAIASYILQKCQKAVTWYRMQQNIQTFTNGAGDAVSTCNDSVDTMHLQLLAMAFR